VSRENRRQHARGVLGRMQRYRYRGVQVRGQVRYETQQGFYSAS
jgi:hypothetical protein